jgi:hypothetical protein
MRSIVPFVKANIFTILPRMIVSAKKGNKNMDINLFLYCEKNNLRLYQVAKATKEIVIKSAF